MKVLFRFGPGKGLGAVLALSALVGLAAETPAHGPAALSLETPEIHQRPVVNTSQAATGAWIDWGSASLHLALSAPLDKDQRNRSSALSRKEAELRALFPSIFAQFLGMVRIDSTRRYRDLIASDPAWDSRLSVLWDKAYLLSANPSPNLDAVRLEYLFRVMPHLLLPFADYQQPRELERVMAWQAAADYTGLVIHAETELPWFGSDRKALLAPALLPRIIDEDGRVVLESGQLLPAALKRWGIAAYSVEKRPELASERAGDRPYVTMARGVFGITPCDVVISREDADMLLYNESTRRVLREGKIIFAIDPSRIREEANS